MGKGGCGCGTSWLQKDFQQHEVGEVWAAFSQIKLEFKAALIKQNQTDLKSAGWNSVRGQHSGRKTQVPRRRPSWADGLGCCTNQSGHTEKQGWSMNGQCDIVGKKANVILGQASKCCRQLLHSALLWITLRTSPVQPWQQALQRI